MYMVSMKPRSQMNWRHVTTAFLCGSLFFSGLAAAQDGKHALSFVQPKLIVKGEDHTPAGGMYVNQGKEVPAALIYEDTTYIPVRMASELLDEPVHWDAEQKAVWIGTVDVPLIDAEGAMIGSAKFSQTDGGVHVALTASGLSPGLHGFHLHERHFEDHDFKTAGGHFNPDGRQHGHDNPAGSHAGDFSNLVVAEDGTVYQTFVIEGLSLDRQAERTIWGKSLIIHAEADDYKSDPAGNAGDRIAGGNIR